jgi:hypothetical protein
LGLWAFTYLWAPTERNKNAELPIIRYHIYIVVEKESNTYQKKKEKKSMPHGIF